MGDDRVKKIPWADPWLDKCEVAAINAVLESRWLGMGARVAEFEDKMHQYIGVKHALAVSNGTVALDLALKVLGVGPGDEVIIPAMTYVATAHAVLYQHARPVFADIELKTFNIEPASVERLITKKTKCIVYIDYGGNPADSVGLQEISERYAIPLLQDGAQSLGGGYNGNRLCKQGTISTTSFHIAKLMTTIEGGMIFTDDEKIAQDLRMMRNQGEDPQRKYIHRVLGTNARMT
ncbi:MAG: DegT/DnrJ/EryC1/StrS family aminotransferase, partial [Candidatus Omnitrophica bacterium]|nr:DegT/DnrJ/EryC1/StrS family aminotransferase [Candidatus Omnitrophota bacterium]